MRRKSRIVTIICFAIILLIGTYDAAASDSNLLRVKQFTATDGLSENTVRDIFSDSDGFLWLSTPNGLNRYDGYQFISFGNIPNDSHVKQVREDYNKLLWIETASDTYTCFEPATGKFLNYQPSDTSIPAYNQIHESGNGDIWLWHPTKGASRLIYKDDGKFQTTNFDNRLINNRDTRITGIAEDYKRHIWFATSAGLRYIDKDSVIIIGDRIPFASVITESNVIHAIGIDGTIYRVNPSNLSISQIGTAWGPISDRQNIYSRGNSLYISTPSGTIEFNSIKGSSIKRLDLPPNAKFFTDNRGNGWMGNSNGTLTRIDRNTGAITSFQVMTTGQIKEIGYERYRTFEDKRGHIWIGTYGNGLFHFTTDGTLLNHYSHRNSSVSFPSDYILCIAGDANGGVWVGTEHNGLIQLKYPEFNYRYIFPAGKESKDRANSFRLVTQLANGEILAANRHGELYRLDRSLKIKDGPSNFSKNVMTAISDSKNNVWLGLRGDGVAVTGPHTTETSSLPHRGFDIFHLLAEKNDNVWMAMFEKGIGVAIPRQEGYQFLTFNDSISGKIFYRFLSKDRNGHIWCATNRGVRVFHPDSLIRYGEKAFRSFDKTNGLPGNEVRQILTSDNGKIWIVLLGEGLAICDNLHIDSIPEFKTITADNGLINNLVQSIVEDNMGNIWVATERGLSRIDITDGLIDSFFPGHDNGSNIFLENSSCRLDDGRLLFGTDYGILSIDASSIESKQPTDTVALTSFSLSDDNDLEARFSTFSYDMDHTTLFSHYLEGIDSAWSIPSTDNVASYKSLPPGKYSLLVKARNPCAGWSKEFKTCEFEVAHGGVSSVTIWSLISASIILSAIILWRMRITINRHPKETVTTEAIPDSIPESSTAHDRSDPFSEMLSVIVESHIADAEYSIDDFASDMCMSRTALYNAMKSHVSMAPMEYLRTQRLNRAAELLLAGSYNVSEVATMVGMKDPLYFSRCFKNRYGLSPTAYMKSARSNTNQSSL